MKAIETFLMNIFGHLFSRAKYSAVSTAERKVRESLENSYDRAISSREKKDNSHQ